MSDKFLVLTLYTDNNAWTPPKLDEWSLNTGTGPHRELGQVESVRRTGPGNENVEVKFRLRSRDDNDSAAEGEEPTFNAYVLKAEVVTS